MRGRILFVVASFATVAAGDVCDPAQFQGVYGFQLAGPAAISGKPQPVVSVGRLIFDGQGGVSGVSSVSFTGLYLGNPVTGMYEARADCSASWSLQDDSGNRQHFDGTTTAGGRRIPFRQTDPGSPAQGTLIKTADACHDADFQPRYRLTVSGSRIDVNSGQVSGSVSATGTLERSGTQLTLRPASGNSASSSGNVDVGDDCFVQLHLAVPIAGADPVEMNFRGMLVDDGRELLGMAVDPGTAVSLRLTAR